MCHLTYNERNQIKIEICLLRSLNLKGCGSIFFSYVVIESKAKPLKSLFTVCNYQCLPSVDKDTLVNKSGKTRLVDCTCYSAARQRSESSGVTDREIPARLCGNRMALQSEGPGFNPGKVRSLDFVSK